MDDDDAIVIIGVGCKYPGADNLDEFWKVLINGENHVNEIPKERWNLEAFYSDDPDKKGKTYVRRAGLLRNHDVWDNKFFGISDTEAEKIDPQQRYVLDCVHMALEDGGITRKEIDGTDTGVYIGFMNDDYRGAAGDGLDEFNNYTLTGTSPSIIAARVSFTYNLLGPSMVLDTACSSALVAVDVGIQALKTGRCKTVIAGGVNSILYPDMFVGLTRARMVSPTGQSQAFSDKADGYARGEGCGIVILTTMKQALQEGRKIRAVIATGCNQDGHTTSPITAPSGTQQRLLLEKVYDEHNINPGLISVIEAHGTGTPVGDPIEANSLGNFFRRNKTEDPPIYIGSVKTNIGHTESAAGTAGLIKILLMMEHEKIVPSLLLDKINPKIDFELYNFEVPRTPLTWKKSSPGPRIACVNSFGFGGTNSHAIVKEYSHTSQPKLKNSESNSNIVMLSSVDHTGLTLTIQQFLVDLQKSSNSISDISYTSMCRRDHFQCRRGIDAVSCEDLKGKCTQILESLKNEKPNIHRPPNIIAVFCGVGTTWQGMCSELLQTQHMFKQTVEEIDTLLQPYIHLSIKEIFESQKALDDPFIGHIAIFTCQVALWSLWKYWGLEVNSVIGQSVGEVAAAYASGSLTLETAVRVIYHRSLALSNTKGGRMFVVSNCSTERVANICKQYPKKACIAVYSSSTSCTVSCDEDVIDDIKHNLTSNTDDSRDRPLFRDLHVRVAYHSFHTTTAGVEVENALKGINSKDPQIPMISTVKGQLMRHGTHMNEEYWRLNVQNPVLFKQAIVAAGKKTKYNIYLEIGPRPVLHAHLHDSFKFGEACCIPSLKPKKELTTIISSVIKLFEKGVNLEWTRFCQISGSLVNIPKYTFNGFKRLFEPESRILKSQGIVNPGSSSHLFVNSADIHGRNFSINFDPVSTAFVYNHFVSGAIIVPGALYAEVALEVGRSIYKTRPQDIEVAVRFLRPLSLFEGRAEIARVSVDKNRENENEYKGEITTGNVLNSTFTVKPKTFNSCPTYIDIHEIRQRCKDFQNSTQTYSSLTRLGFSYGEYLQVLGDVWKNNDECLVEIRSSHINWEEVASTHFHPVILDGLVQMLGIFESNTIDRTIIPCGMEKVILQGVLERSMLGYGQVVSRNKSFITYNMLLLSTDGRVLAEVKNCESKFVGEHSHVQNELAYELLWRPAVVNETRTINGARTSHIFLMAFDEVTLEEVESVFNGTHFKSLLVYNRSFEDVKQLFKGMLQKENPIVCLFPGKRIDNDSKGINVLEAVQLSCMTVLAYLQTVVELNKDMPCYIVTEKTQGTQSNNIYGAEIWGQVRCAMWEKPLPIRLVDVQSSLHDAKSFISDLVLEKITIENACELVFTNGRVLINNFHFWQDFHKNDNLRLATFDDTCEIHVRSSHSLDIKRRFGMVQLERKPRSKNTTLIKVETSCIHHKEVCPLIIKDPKNGVDISTKENEAGYNIITLELIGTEMSDGKVVRHSNNPLVVACYPMELSSVVSVPACCVFEKNKLPWYQPGLVFVSVLLLTLVNHIEDKATVIVLYDEFSRFQAQLLEVMLLTMKNSKVELIDELDSELQLSDNVTLVPMVWLNGKWFDSLDKQKNKQINLVTLSCFVNKHIIQWLTFKMNRPRITVVETTQATAKRNFHGVVPKVFKWLNQNLSKVSLDKSIIDPVNVLGIPCNTMSLTNSALSNIKLKAPRNSPFRMNGCYVVVGGLTGLGWEIVNLLAEMKAGIIVILSRRTVPTDKQQKMNELSHYTGCKIYAFSTDITDMGSLQNTFDKLKQLTDYPIKGIFQGAAVLMDCLFQKMNSGHYESVLRPKVLGTWNLHRLSHTLPLDYFMMHSSVASVFGNQGQTNYGAANAFMDGLARYRRSIGLSAQSINWGPLAVGMGTNDKTVQNNLKTFGFLPLNVSDIRTCLLNCLNSSKSQITIGSFDWNKIESNTAGGMAANRFKLIFEANKHRNVDLSDDHLVQIQGISFESDSKRLEFISDLVLQTVHNCFAVEKETLSKDTVLSDLGIDSMQAMTFVNMIHERTNIRLSVVVILTAQTTLQKITDILDEQLSSQGHSKSERKPDVDDSVFWSMTQMEKYRHDMYLVNPKDPNLFTVLDLEIPPKLSNQGMWTSALLKVHKKHSGLRTLFIPSNDNIRYGFKRKIVNAKEVEIDFQTVEMSELLSMEGNLNDTEKYLFDPSKNIPLRTFYASTADECVIRFVFSLVCLDLSSIFTVLKDLKTCMITDDGTPKRYDDEEDLTTDDDEEEKDLAAIFETRVQQQMQSLKSFWKSELVKLHPIESLTLGNDVNIEMRRVKMSSESIDLSFETISNLETYLKDEGVKLFDFIATIYEILLYTELHVPALCIEAVVDLRLHFPEMRDRVCRFTNRIPLIAKFEDSNVTLKEFLRVNAENILKAIDKSLLPNKEIWKLASGFDESKFRRHLLIMEDISLFSQLGSDNTESHVRLKNIHTTNSYYDTVLLVWLNKSNKTIKLEFGFSQLAITDKHAKNLMKEMLDLIQKMIEQSDKRVFEIGKPQTLRNNTNPDQFANCSESKVLLTSGISGEITYAQLPYHDQQPRLPVNDPFLKTDVFMKQTSRGWDHEVHLSAQMSCRSKGHDGWNLFWGPRKKQTARSLPFSQIQRTDLEEMNGQYCILIHTEKRNFTFKTRHRHTAIEWVELMKQGLH